MKKFKLLLPAKIAVTCATFLFGTVFTAGSIAIDNSGAINDKFNVKTQIIVDGDDTDEDSEYFKSKFNSVEEVQSAGAEFCYNVEAEGATLLKNDGALPLANGAKVSLFSYSSVDMESRGYGSGAGSNATEILDLKTALESDGGAEVNPTLWNWYKNNPQYRRDPSDSAHKTVKMLEKMNINDAPWSAFNGAVSGSYPQYSDAAIFVLSRSGGENADMRINTGNKNDMTDGDYLKLSPSEISILKGIKSLKGSVFKKIIVIMNTASPVQCEFADNEEYGIDGVLWVGLIGSNGNAAVADILKGKVNPSGRLTDTYWKYHYKNPVLANFGDMRYDDSYGGGDTADRYVVYQEGIFNGYRYTETRYEDYVMGAGNAGEFDYFDTVSYPFGYGLTYSEFTYSAFKADVKMKGGKTFCELSVRVTNSGDAAGRETVQFYIQKPYTDYDKTNGIEKAAVELVGFGKTGILEKGESQTVTATVEGNELLSYDGYGYGTYILEGGEYYFTAAKDAHDAVNNVLAAKGYDNGKMTAKGNAEIVKKHTVRDTDAETYAYDDSTGKKVKIENRFADADLKLYEGAGDNAHNFEYVTRKDWSGTVCLGYDENSRATNEYVKLSRTAEMREDIADKTPVKDNAEYPVYGSTETSYSLINLRAYSDGTPIEYDNEMWEHLLDQLTWEETCALLENGYRSTRAIGGSINKPATVDHNGSIGVCQAFSVGSSGLAVKTGDPDKDGYPAIYPCSGIVASTFNRELVNDFGKQWGEECLWAGYSGLYGPSVNLHRGQYCGRSFEYYSEDPLLSGDICAKLTEGITEKGVYVYLKHCILNDQETSRHGIGTWANEQTIRELYLRPFEIAIKEGGAQCVMTGFNRIGARWTGTHGFCNTVLKNEFGMSGFAVSDNPVKTYMTIPYGVLNGNDLPDYTCNGIYQPYEQGYGELAFAMREAAHRILYTVVHSNAMNGITSSTKIVVVTPAWVTAVRVAQIVCGVIFGLSLAFLTVALYFYYSEKRKAATE